MVEIVFSSITAGFSSLLKATIIVVGLFEGSNNINDHDILGTQKEHITQTIKKFNQFKGKYAEFLPIITTDDNKVVLVVGLGKPDELDENNLLRLGGKIYTELKKIKVDNAIVSLKVVDNKNSHANIAYGAFLSSFEFNKYFTKNKETLNTKINKITFITDNIEYSNDTFNKLKAEGESIFLARSLVAEPPNVLNPETYSKIINNELTKVGIKVSIYDENFMHQQRMGALLGVAQGSSNSNKPRLVVMEWKGSNKNDQPIAFVGKGVTFDSGGISIKPSKGMWEMKHDMAGSASVVGIMRTLAARQAKVNAIGIVGLVENSIGSNAQRPSDIVTSMSGQTIEVLNTDAEGRLVLADALWYAQKTFKPKLIIDLATLTGAVIVSLGNNIYGGLFSNNDDISNNLINAGIETNEKVWRLPLDEQYDKMLDSSIADMQNISTKGYGADSITAAQFLQRFIDGNTPWAHLDIAGMAWNNEGTEISPKGATGFGIRLLNRLISNYYE